MIQKKANKCDTLTNRVEKPILFIPTIFLVAKREHTSSSLLSPSVYHNVKCQNEKGSHDLKFMTHS